MSLANMSDFGNGFRSRLRGSGGSIVTVARPYRVAVYGDSFAQRANNILGVPSILDYRIVDPQNERWGGLLTSPVGGVLWGVSTWADMLSGGKFTFPWQLNNGIGGFNTGQLNRFGGADPTPWYLSNFLNRINAYSGVERADCVLYQAGTNDGVTAFTAASSYNNTLTICQKIVASGYPVFLSTVLPRGNSVQTSSRLTGPRITETDAFNALLIANLAAEPTLNGMVRVIDPRASFRDGAGQANDILDALVYDGLHLSPVGCRILAQAYLVAMNAYYTATISGHLPVGATYIANGLMTGTGGSFVRSGNAATNTSFTLNGGTVSPVTGVTPDNWTVGPTLNGGASAWNGTSPNNITGNMQVSIEAAAVGSALRVDLTCNGSGLTTANTRAVEAYTDVTLPSTAVLAVGDYYRGIAVVELSGHAGLRGVGCELRVTEPDCVAGVTQAPHATGTITVVTAGLDGDTYTVAGVVYTLKTVLPGTPNQFTVLIGVDANATATNLNNAINATSTGWGADTTRNPYVAAAVATNVITLSAYVRTDFGQAAAPNGTANMTIDSATNYVGAGRFVLMTPPVKRIAGTYGLIRFAVYLYVAGQANPITATWKLSQAGVIKVT